MGLVFQRASGSILRAWLLLALIQCIALTIAALPAIAAEFVDDLGTLAALASFSLGLLGVAALVCFVTLVGQWALFMPLNNLLFVDPVERLGVWGTLMSVKSVYFPTLAAFLFLIIGGALGVAICILPGFIVGFLFCQSYYLTAAKRMGPFAALARSFKLNTRHWTSVILLPIGALGVLIVASILLSALSLGGSATTPMDSRLDAISQLLLSEILSFFVLQVAFFLIFLLHAALFSYIETQETGRLPVQ
ncbi:hypothetical protein [Bradymonas sediminis]|uniref:Glycerophosphoryl diester phosphodiesterase membrane domain-containing protein n=1 Tax=Bradymonas sediminis TaxID=1548548 RepID=A0A2Z4FMU9_9DELT|nr:hypothetical protein [Bradymonas sediminis]AWV90014.1 hypothetical protein DN745_11955 [Bradymonas sediminis]